MMKYGLLTAYRNYLLGIYRPETAQTYYKKLCTLFDGQNLLYTASNLDIDKILDNLSTIKHKNRFSQSKNAFLHFCKFQNIALPYDKLETIKQLEKGTKKKHRKLKVVEFATIDKTIKHLRNKKLKLSYQTLIATGLRVSELASITLEDCTITEDEIKFTFVGKGGAYEVVELQKITYYKLYQDLKEHIKSAANGKNVLKTSKVFYSANYLQRRSKELGFGCHDLRRAFAKLEYKKCRSQKQVMEKLRHASVKTTKIYLRSKVKL